MKKKTAMITGASRGIGHAIATTFARAGYDLALSCRHRIDLLEELSANLEEKYGIQCLCFCGDMGNFDTVKQFTEDTLAHFGQIDVLINNAGISYIGLLTDMSPAQWQDIIQSNLTSIFNTCHEVIPSMVREKSGHIINISSVWGCCGASCEVAYSASKGAINAFTQALAKELAPSDIQVNAIACGTIDTEMNHFLSEEDRQALADEIPAGRFGKPEEVGQFALQLAEGPSYLTGQVIKLDGAWI